MHFRLTAQFGHAQAEGPAVRTDSLSQRFIRVENRSKTEGQHRPAAEAYAHDPGMLEDVLLPKLHIVALIFADHDVEFTAGIGQNSGSVHALNPFQQGRTTRTCSIG